MGAIRETSTGRTRILESSHVVGRMPSPKCSLTLDERHVSGVHAEFRWTGVAWELKDLGSRNGTFLNGRRIDSSSAHALVRGSTIAFGKAEQEWVLSDDSAPAVMAIPLSGGEPVVLDGDLLALPSSDDPRATIYRTLEGQWLLECADEPPRPLAHQQTFDTLGMLWRFSCGDMPQATLAVSEVGVPRLEVGAMRLFLSVSRDEEYVHLKMQCGDQEFDMGARRHNYLLLTLARRRLADAASGLPDSSCGWIDQGDVAHDPTMAPPQLSIDTFRIREQFGKVGVLDAAGIIQRRPRQIRVGTPQITIVML